MHSVEVEHMEKKTINRIPDTFFFSEGLEQRLRHALNRIPDNFLVRNKRFFL